MTNTVLYHSIFNGQSLTLVPNKQMQNRFHQQKNQISKFCISTFHSGPKPHKIIKVPIIIIIQRGIQLASSQWTLLIRGHFLCTDVAVSLCQGGGLHAYGNKFSCKCYQFLSNSHKIIILKIWCNHYGRRHGITRFVHQPDFRNGPKSLSSLFFFFFSNPAPMMKSGTSERLNEIS